MVTITKFMFICVWKSMRTMNDDLMVRIAVNQALLFSSIIGLLKIQAQVSLNNEAIKSNDTIFRLYNLFMFKSHKSIFKNVINEKFRK